MTPHSITVLERYDHSWPKFEFGEQADVMSLTDALTRSWPSDKHFSCYVTPNARRLHSTALKRVDVPLTAICFDVDFPGHVTPPESWRAEMRAKYLEIDRVHGGLYAYGTRGGERLVWLQSEPTVIRSYADAKEWRRDYAVAIAYLRRRFGIEADLSCSDWTRLYRLPDVERDGKRQRFDAFGDPRAVGALRIVRTEADRDQAKRDLPNAFTEWPVRDYGPYTGDGRGVFYHLLLARGLIVRPNGAGQLIVVCPRDRYHTTGRPGDSGTVLWLGPRGWLHCSHEHCNHLTPHDWLAMFGPHELEAARRAAGIHTTQGRRS